METISDMIASFMEKLGFMMLAVQTAFAYLQFGVIALCVTSLLVTALAAVIVYSGLYGYIVSIIQSLGAS